ncbi:hypothetical protein XMD564_002019 [Marinobacterium sp. xm-d-564]|nr:hypothetical protein [Marinobacterium sp. xm-d-564]
MVWVVVTTHGALTRLTHGLSNTIYVEKAASAAFFVPVFTLIVSFL